MLNPINFLAGRAQSFAFESGGRPVTLECSLPAGDGPYSAVMLLHGSDGLASSGPRFRLMMQALAGLGYAALLPHYFQRTGDDDLGGGAHRAEAVARSYPLWQETVADAVTEAGRLPRLDPRRLALVGFSLGAFLAIGVAARRPDIRCVVEFCGGLPEGLTGHRLALPPVLILHGEADATVSVEHAHALARALGGSGVPHEMQLYPGQGHIFSGAAERDALQRSLAFLERHLAASPVP